MVKPKEVDIILAAEWLHNLPGYRELLRQRISTAQKRRMMLDRRMLKIVDDVDNLGREVEGCG